MRKSNVIFILMGLISVIFLGTASAGQFGAPELSADDKYISVGGGYFYNADKWTLKSNSKDYKYSQNQIYLQFSAASNNIESYFRGGVADLKIDNAFAASSSDTNFNDDYKFFGIIGVKGFFSINRNFGIGVFAQGSFFPHYTSNANDLVSGIPETQELQIKDYGEADFGLTLQGKFDKILLYAGPFCYWTHANLEATITRAGLTTSSASSNFKQSNLGGVAGIKIPIVRKINIEFEGQYRHEFSGGGAIIYSF